MKWFNESARRGVKRARRKLPSFPLGVELFEQRLLLAAFIVDSNGDTGTGVGNAGDLRYVITQLDLSADPSNTIDFQIAPLGTLATIMLGSDLPAISQPVSMTRPGRARPRTPRARGPTRTSWSSST